MKKKGFICFLSFLVFMLSFLFVPFKVLANSITETEPNDDFENACSFNVSDTMSANLSSKDDVDYFSFELSSIGYFTIDFAHDVVPGLGSIWKLYIYNASFGEIVDTTSISAATTLTTSPKVISDIATYYIKVTMGDGFMLSSGYSSETYNITVKFTETDEYETDRNDDIDHAEAIELGTKKNESMSSIDDIDWFSFVAPDDGYFDISFTHDKMNTSAVYWRLYLYDKTGTTGIDGINTYYQIAGNKEEIKTSIYGISKGTYFIKVIAGSSSSFTSNDYGILINFTKAQDYEKENNTVLDKATSIDMFSYKKGTISTDGDIDYYTFSIDKDEYLGLTFEHEVMSRKTSNIWKVQLVNADTNVVIHNIDIPGNKGTTKTAQKLSKAGNYYIKVTGSGSYNSDDSTKVYTLKLHKAHVHEGEWAYLTRPTCLEGGEMYRYCTLCGEYGTMYVGPLGHSYDRIIVVSEATCEENGLERHVCSRCGELEKEVIIEALGHDYIIKNEVEQTLLQQGEKEYVCTHCYDTYTKKDMSLAWAYPAIVILEIGIVIAFIVIKKKKS